MSWNYRVLQYADGTFGLHECFYEDGSDDPHSCTETAVAIVGDDLTELFSSLAMMTAALTKPVLQYAIFAAMAAPSDPIGEASRG